MSVAPKVAAISLYITTTSRPNRLILGVRAGTPTNRRHTDVLSTPTQRIPWCLLEELSGPVAIDWTRREAPSFVWHGSSGAESVIGVQRSMSDPLSFAVESLMARKMDLGRALVMGAMRGHARLIASSRDIVLDQDESDAEDTHMLTVHVVLDSVPEVLPSAAYRRFDWVNALSLRESVERRDALSLIPNETPWSVCLRGLCVRSAAFASERLGEGS